MQTAPLQEAADDWRRLHAELEQARREAAQAQAQLAQMRQLYLHLEGELEDRTEQV